MPSSLVASASRESGCRLLCPAAPRSSVYPPEIDRGSRWRACVARGSLPSVSRNVFLAILIAGSVLRFVAIPWNAEAPHGDVHLDAVTLHSLWQGDGFVTPLGRSVEMYPPRHDPSAQAAQDRPAGYPADQHPPLLLLLAWPLRAIVADPYFALQIVTLIAGLLLLLATWRTGARLFDESRGRLAAALVAGSFLLVDFSANGSIYILQALWLVLAVCAFSRVTMWAWLVGGALLGLGWLTNYQALIAIPAAALAALLSRDPLSLRIGRIAAMLLGFAAVAWPWWMRNVAVFSDPFFSVNPLYLKAWLGASLSLTTEQGVDVLQTGPLTASSILRALKGILVVNGRMFLSQSAWWMGPLLSAGVIGALRAVGTCRERSKCGVTVLALLAAIQVAVLWIWPAAKFRYLVPIVPLLALLAAGAFRKGPSSAPGSSDGSGSSDASETSRASGVAHRAGQLTILLVVLIGCERLLRGSPQDGVLILVAALAMVAVGPLAIRRGRPGWLLSAFLIGQAILGFSARGSTYYDGILIGDTFGRRGVERADRARQRELKDVAGLLVERDAAGVIGPIELKYPLLVLGAETSVIQPSPPAWAGDAAAAGAAIHRTVQRHRVDHAVVFSEEEADLFRAAVGAEEVSREEGFDDGSDGGWILLWVPRPE